MLKTIGKQPPLKLQSEECINASCMHPKAKPTREWAASGAPWGHHCPHVVNQPAE